MWKLKDYEKAGKDIGTKFVSGGGKTSINDLAVKVASDNGLNPEEIRTVVRIANVEAFEGYFEKRSKDSSADRDIEFEVGDPEVVIRKLHKEAKDDVLGPDKPADGAEKTADIYGDIRPVDIPLEKVASDNGLDRGVEHPAVTPIELKHRFKLAERKMDDQRRQLEQAWHMSLEKAAQCLRVDLTDPALLDDFEKNAAAVVGADITPELMVLRSHTGTDKSRVMGGEKIASVLEGQVGVVAPQHKRIIEMLKTAHHDRVEHDRCVAGVNWIRANMDRIK